MGPDTAKLGSRTGFSKITGSGSGFSKRPGFGDPYSENLDPKHLVILMDSV
jgi:hypothetical protein